MLEQRFNALKRTIARLDRGEFYFSDVYGTGWDNLYVGDKVKLGREFLTWVRKGYFADVLDTGRKKGGGRVYLKL